MSASEYTPTTEEVRALFALQGAPRSHADRVADFNRWLAAHQAALTEEAAKVAEKFEYIRDWDGYTCDDASYLTRTEVADAIRTLTATPQERSKP